MTASEGWTGLLAVMARLFATGAILAALGVSAFGYFRRKAERPVSPPIPRRRARRELASILAQAETRPWSRDLAAERLRRLARDAVAARMGVDDRTAREIVESGAWDADGRLLEFLSTDWLSQGRQAGLKARRTDFIEGYRRALDLLEEWSQGEPRRET